MLLYFLWLSNILILNFLAAIFARRRAEKHLSTPYKALPDLLQENLPVLHTHIPDYMLLLISIFVYFSNIKISKQELNALFYCLSLRPVFVCVTTFPTCMKKPKMPQTFSNKLFHSTHDLMFSGHTCWFIFFGKLIGGNVGNIVQLILPISLIQSKQHYTIDVLVSMFVYNSIKQFPVLHI